MEFRVLGGLAVYDRGSVIEVGAPKQRAVLAALLVNANEPVLTDTLIDSVWWVPPPAAASNLRLYIAGLRRVLSPKGEAGSRMESSRAGGYLLRVMTGELDLDRFLRFAEHGESALRAGRLSHGADYLGRALKVWRGRALEGVAHGPGLQRKAALLEEQRLAVAERWARACLDLRQPESIVVTLRELTKDYPLRERLWAYLMLALSRSGRPSEALAAYAEVRAMLADELGADPGPELLRLYQLVLHSDHSMAPSNDLQQTDDPADMGGQQRSLVTVHGPPAIATALAAVPGPGG